MGCRPWIPRNSSHRPQYDDTGASRHVESNTVEVLWVSAGFVATDFPSGPRPLPTHAQPACFPRPTKNSEEPDNLPSLLEIGDVYAVGLLGEPGKSIQERPITTDADQAAWLAETLAALPEEAFHIVGLSIGGWSAVNLALHDPARIATLTLIDPVFRSEERRVGKE